MNSFQQGITSTKIIIYRKASYIIAIYGKYFIKRKYFKSYCYIAFNKLFTKLRPKGRLYSSNQYMLSFYFCSITMLKRNKVK